MTTTYYSVIQYVSDPIIDERVNIGVIAYDAEGQWIMEQVLDWRRAHRFTGIPPAKLNRHLADIRATLERATSPKSFVDAMAKWTHSIQVTPPRASVDPVDVTCKWAASRMLHGDNRKYSQRAKPRMLRVVRETFAQALADRGLETLSDNVLSVRRAVPGKVESHTLDFAIANGHLLLAAQALPFPERRSSYVDNEISATAWAIEDIHARDDSPRLAVVVASPQDKQRPDYVRALSVLQEVSDEVVDADSIGTWARRTVASFQDQLAMA